MPCIVCMMMRRLGDRLIDVRCASDHGVTQFTALRSIDLSHNELRELPRCFFAMPVLETVVLDFNKLRTLPSSIQEAHALRRLSVCNNNLLCVPREIGGSTRGAPSRGPQIKTNQKSNQSIFSCTAQCVWRWPYY
jgi:Leucine-rich repeat (LRR) protein